MPYIPKQYDSAKAFAGTSNSLGNITDTMDAQRISAYTLYDDFYYNRPDAFKVTLRGDSDIEIYLPSTKKIVDGTARFLAVDFDFNISGGDQSAVNTLLRNTFKREEIPKRFVKAKRSMLTRGDQAWYITADSRKRRGERLSINTIHPSSVFPIEDPENPWRVIGYHIVDVVKDPRNKDPDSRAVIARRQTYRKENGRITSECIGFELGAWDDRHLKVTELKPVWNFLKKTELPQQITQLPVYFIPNNEPDGSSYGTSQIAGMEYIVNALNQSMTYEDLSLVLQGLGVYVTTSAPPEGKDGRPGKYQLHPGNVVEMSQGDTFERVTGIASVAPFQDHLELMDKWMSWGVGLPEMATGTVDVAVAQSGIALALKMGPIIAENEDKELAIKSKWDQFGYDLIHGWLPAFEEIDSPATVFETTFGDPMPINRETWISETIDLFTAGLILIDEVRERLERVGYKSIPNIEDKLLAQQQRWSNASSGDPMLGEAGANFPNLRDFLSNEDENGSGTLQLVT